MECTSIKNHQYSKYQIPISENEKFDNKKRTHLGNHVIPVNQSPNNKRRITILILSPPPHILFIDMLAGCPFWSDIMLVWWYFI